MNGTRRAENEAFFRALNDRIERLGDDVFPSDEARGARPYDFVCECSDRGCTERVALTLPEYETIRRDDRSFLVAPAPEHVDPVDEDVVDRGTRYWVVRKTGEAAARVAEADEQLGRNPEREPDV